MKSRWQIRLAQQAQRDFAHILVWTAARFGERQARIYATTLRRSITALMDGPDIIGCRAREEFGPGLLSLHVARKGRKGRHFILLRTQEATRTIEVLRILHDSMDLARHLKD